MAFGRKWVTLGEAHEIITGSTPSRQCEECYGGDIPFVKPPDLSQGEQLVQSSEYLTEKGAQSVPCIPANSTLVCCIGSVGKSAFTRIPVRTNQQINSLIPSAAVFPKYTYYYSLTPFFQRLLHAQVSITTIAIVSKSRLSKLPFPLPSMHEQLQIVNEIERDLARLDRIEQLVREAKELGNELRQSILAQTFSSYRRKSADWNVMPFGELVRESKVGLARKQVDQSINHPYGYFKMNNITAAGELDWDDLTKVHATEEEVEAYTLCNDDLLLNMRNSWGLVGKNAIFTNKSAIPDLFNNNIMRIRFKEGVHPWYVHYYLQSPDGLTGLGQIKRATTNVAAIYAREVFQIPVPCPSLTIQTRMVDEIQQAFLRERKALHIMKESICLQSLRAAIVEKHFSV
ncbi:restriction endonuclease subunit S [Brevibacillus sp. SYSU BS000544]|uniref:restriction endonuclease subunit S n=1 Tax=Brevibacillus sp. SYSU BS000544 TaxID=3416443 RepID=UPI003CE535B6